MAQRLNKVSISKIIEWSKEDGGRVLIRKLQDWGAIPGAKGCAKCGKAMSMQKDGRGEFKWRCSKMNAATGQRCYYGASVTAGTMFDDRRVPIHIICIFILMFVKSVPLAADLIDEHLSSATLVSLFKLFRAICFNGMMSNPVPIGGPGCTVEIDESKFGKRKYHRGKKVEGQWVFGGYCRESGLVFMLPVEKRDRDTLLPEIQKWILPGTKIISDGWKAYRSIPEIPGFNYEFAWVNHTKNFVDPVTGAHTQGIESSWRAAKSKYCPSGRRKIYFRGHLAKYMFLRKCKVQGWSPFEAFLKMAGRTVFPLSQELLGELYALPIDENSDELPSSEENFDTDAEEDEDYSDAEVE